MATSKQLRQQIQAGEWDGTLRELYGAQEAALVRQRRRYCEALSEFERYFGPERQVHLYSAPGRTELGGNHTDHQQGFGLAAAVDLDLVAVACPGTDGYIRVKSRGFNKLDVIDLSQQGLQTGEGTHSASLIRGIAEGFQAQGAKVGGLDLYTTSDVLRGSGLSSSAAFEMGVAAALNGEYQCGFSAPQMALLCQQAENTYFGKPSGLLDQLTSAVGGVVFADFARPAAPQVTKLNTQGLLPPEICLCVTDTRASHSELTGEFAAIRQEMESVAAALGEPVLGQIPEEEFWGQLPRLRRCCGDRVYCGHCIFLRRIVARLCSFVRCARVVLGSFYPWCGTADILPLRHVRTFIAHRNRKCKGCPLRWLSVSRCWRGQAVPGGCRVAALQARSRRSCPEHPWDGTAPLWKLYLGRAAATCCVCGSRGLCG